MMAKKYIPTSHGEYLEDSRKPLYPSIKIGDNFWFTWLKEPDVKSFCFNCPMGSITVRRETRKTSENFYWYGYKEVEGKLRKKYLGTTDQLNYQNLLVAARELCLPSLEYYANKAHPESAIAKYATNGTEKLAEKKPVVTQAEDSRSKATIEFLKTELEQERERANNLQKQLQEQKEQLTQLTQQLIDAKMSKGALKQEIHNLQEVITGLNKDKTRAEIKLEQKENCLTLPKIESTVNQLLKNKTITKTGKDRTQIKRAFEYLLTQLTQQENI